MRHSQPDSRAGRLVGDAATAAGCTGTGQAATDTRNSQPSPACKACVALGRLATTNLATQCSSDFWASPILGLAIFCRCKVPAPTSVLRKRRMCSQSILRGAEISSQPCRTWQARKMCPSWEKTPLCPRKSSHPPSFHHFVETVASNKHAPAWRRMQSWAGALSHGGVEGAKPRRPLSRAEMQRSKEVRGSPRRSTRRGRGSGLTEGSALAFSGRP